VRRSDYGNRQADCGKDNKMKSASETIIILSIILLHPAPSFAKEVVQGPIKSEVVSVYDGDTFTASVKIWLHTNLTVKIRINGIDTPEKRTKCAKEKRMALIAKDVLEQMIKGSVYLSNIQYGKYAGRVLADVATDEFKSIGAEMIKRGLAVPYDGGKRKEWCK